WIQFTLSRTATLSQIVLKFTQTPRDDSYPLAIQINGTNVYTGTPPTTLGYVTLDLPPVTGSIVRVSRTPSGGFPMMEIEFYERPSVTPPRIANFTLHGSQLSLDGTGGMANRPY